MPILQISRSGQFQGACIIPGDKSISHRSLIFGAMAIEQTEIYDLLLSEDVIATAKALEAMGIHIARHSDKHWTVTGGGPGGLQAPDKTLEMGNSGTSTRLLMGVVAGHHFEATFKGDASLSKRPMARVLDPLSDMGLTWHKNTQNPSGEDRLPLTIKGPGRLLPTDYKLPIPSAQVKSAILLAGVNAPGLTTVIEPQATRDHTENMLRAFGANITVTAFEGGKEITLEGEPILRGQEIHVPADPSSAAFICAAALICPGSDITLKNILMNETRAGFFTCLKEMGAPIFIKNERLSGGEKVADIHIQHGPLEAIETPPERAPSMIDEYPILAVLCAYAKGTSRLRGLEELRVKESDRLAAVYDGLKANHKLDVKIDGDDLIIEGNGTGPQGGGFVTTHLDHRIAMSFLIMGLGAENPITIDDHEVMNTSFPGFTDLLQSHGAKLKFG